MRPRLVLRVRRGLIACVGATSLVAGNLSGSGVAAPRPDLDQARRQVAALYHKAEQATERYNDVRIALTEAERQFRRVQQQAARQQVIVAQLQRTVGAFAADAYRNAGINPTLQLVFSDDPQAFVARAALLEVLSARQAATLRKVIEARRVLAANQNTAAAHLGQVENQRRALAAEKAEVEQNLRAARTVLDRLQAKERAALLGRSSRKDDRTRLTALPLPDSSRAGEAVKFALQQIGDRYVWAAAGPDAWDCSGLTMAAWRAAGVSLPHSSAQQFTIGRKIPRAELAPGDLVYFYSPISHVGIYIGNGLMVDAPNPSERVRITPISTMPYAGATRP